MPADRIGKAAHRVNRLQTPAGIALEAVASTPPRSDRSAMDEALRLLAVWAVRAAQGQTRGPDSDLTVSPPRVMNASGTDAEEKP
jgi:hypothetical protein